MNIKVMYAPIGSNCRPGYKLAPTYITIHNTANTSRGAGAVNHGRYLQGAGRAKYVSWHFAVDDKCIVQSIPDYESAWHAGDGNKGTGNRTSLAIEICENPDSDLMRATNNAAELTAHLMRKFNIPLDHVVQHNHWTGKDCPRQIRRGRPYDWGTFKANVKAFYDAKYQEKAPEYKGLYRVQVGAFRDKKNAQAYVDELKSKGITAIIVED